jgi:hypothetical protein
MAIYSKPVRLLMKEMVADLGLEADSVLTRAQALEWFSKKYPKIKPATVSAHLIRCSSNAPSRVHYSVNPLGDDDIFYQLDGGHYRLHDKAKDPPPIYSKVSGLAASTTDFDQGQQGDELLTDDGNSEFAYERDLRSYLSKHLKMIEPGLRLYEDGGITGIEFPVGGRYIDILAVDKQNSLVVVELKVSKGYDRVVGQVLRYMGWIKEFLAEDKQKVRGIIIAREISQDVILAASLVPSLELFEYQLSVSLHRVQPS